MRGLFDSENWLPLTLSAMRLAQAPLKSVALKIAAESPLPTGERRSKRGAWRYNGCWSVESFGASKVSPGVAGSSVLSGALMSSPLAFHQVEP